MDEIPYPHNVYLRGLEKVVSTPPPDEQVFKPGTFVFINNYKDKSKTPARVSYTYAHAHGGPFESSYSLLVRNKDGKWTSSSWYGEHCLSIVDDEELIKSFINEIRIGYK